MGALWGSLLAWGITYLPGLVWQLVAIVAVNMVGVPLCTAAGQALGGKKDNQAIVWDEMAAMPIVFVLVPLSGWVVGLVGFGLFRLLDITKPPPARQLERLPEGLGVMADDWIAAAYACIALWLLTWLDGLSGLGILTEVAG